MKSIFTTLFLFFAFFAQAQEGYFQQDVAYTIKVSLDDVSHKLTGDISIDYTNHAPFELDTIYFHLWPNAYSSKQTAYAKQQISNPNSDFYFASDKDLGYIKDIDFKVNNYSVKWHYLTEEDTDIAYILLNQPLATGKTVTITTPFTVKIPKSFSRLGHIETSYQITQWYPKPAVLDRYGWHPMPYLNLGEFYSEFGSFDVSITLPQNYVVGATGVLETQSEIDFLKDRVAQTEDRYRHPEGLELTDSFPVSSPSQKTIHYTADNVHDFAWFADKRFNVLKGEVKLKSGKIVDTWTMFANETWSSWEKSIDYVNQAVASYSEWVGDYPYPQATAVQSALSAGSGMEYPMITVIGSETGKMLDNVIAHEVGHNWFYGILGSNERQYPWMDEGLNSYYDARYMDKYYKKYFNEMSLVYKLKARNNEDPSPSTLVQDMGEISYAVTAYAKPSIALKTLAEFVEQKRFDEVMQSYFNTWKFRHPDPTDFRQMWIDAGYGAQDWFFDGIVKTNKKVDYKLVKIKKIADSVQVEIKNKGHLNAPLLLYGVSEGEAVGLFALEGFEGTQTFTLANSINGISFDEMAIDYKELTLDLNAQDNSSRPAHPKIKLFFGREKKDKRQLFVLPMYAWNAYDRSMVGATFYNEGVLGKPFYFDATPMYSFGANRVVGTANFAYSIHPKGPFITVAPKIAIKRFTNFQNDDQGYSTVYTHVVPSIEFKLKEKKENLHRKRTFRLAHEILQKEHPIYDDSGSFKHLEQLINQYDILSFQAKKKNAIFLQEWETGLEYGQYDNFNLGKKTFLKAFGHYKSAFFYEKNKAVSLGLHGGYFLQNDARYSNSYRSFVEGSFATASTGFDDYSFRQFYLGRSEREGIFGQQIYSGDAGMKHPKLNGPKGYSNDWMLGINLISDLPINLPKPFHLKPYIDAAFWGKPKDKTSTEMDLMYSGGIQLSLGFMQINFPLVNDKELNDLLKQRKDGSYLGRITYSINFNLLSPKKLAETIIPD